VKKRRHSLVLAADNGEETGERAEAHLLLGLVEGAEGSSGEQSSGSRARGDGSSLAFISRRAIYIHTMIALGPQFFGHGHNFWAAASKRGAFPAAAAGWSLPRRTRA
jgi:hypothetical protein